MRVALIDYGAGNPQSVQQALLRTGAEVVRVEHPEQAHDADALVMPGQGHFGQVMEAFLQRGFERLVRDHLAAGRPFLGICVGLQLLMEGSDEAPGIPGLGVLPGRVVRFPEGDHVSVPHMGWNQLEVFGATPLLVDIPTHAHAYFAHSYVVVGTDAMADGGTWTQHGSTRFLSAFSRGRLHATQFHPEKSQAVGLRLLQNFVNDARKFVFRSNTVVQA